MADLSLRRILIVEDDQSIVRMLCFCLESANFDVTQVADGIKALEALEQDKYEVVLLDLGLPDGMDGAVLRRLRQLNKAHQVWIALSALDHKEATSRYGAIPTGRFLAKPFDPWRLVRKLETMLKTRNEPQQA